jgi:predicted phosphodiesterase
MAELELAGKRIAVTHYPDFAKGLAATGKYDAVFHGHTHDKYKDKMGSTLICNPGEIMGRKGKPSFAVYDTVKNEIKHYEF